MNITLLAKSFEPTAKRWQAETRFFKEMPDNGANKRKSWLKLRLGRVSFPCQSAFPYVKHLLPLLLENWPERETNYCTHPTRFSSQTRIDYRGLVYAITTPHFDRNSYFRIRTHSCSSGDMVVLDPDFVLPWQATRCPGKVYTCVRPDGAQLTTPKTHNRYLVSKSQDMRRKEISGMQKRLHFDCLAA